MKKLWSLLLLFGSVAAWAGNSSLTVSSGTFKAIDGWTESTNSQFRQSIVIADPSALAGTAPVDALTGLTVHLASSSYTQPVLGTVNVISTTTLVVSGPINVISSNTLTVGGAAAVAATASGSPLRAGGDGHTALPSAVSDGQAQAHMLDKYGRQVGILDCPRDLLATSTGTYTTSTSEFVFISSGAASVFNDLVSVLVLNTSATAARIDFRSGGGPSAGAISFALYVPAGETRGLTTAHIWPQSTAASNWTIQSSQSVTDIRVYATYCQNK